MFILHNYPLFAALITNVLTQVCKVFVHYLLNRSWKWSLLISTGGLPSSHSATVASLTVAIGITEGVLSSIFAVSVVLSVIVMFDAAGIRRHAGQQAVVLNRLIKEFQHLFEDRRASDKVLKEMLGHKPVEVLAGAIFGLIVSIVIFWLMP
jgi:acid phosphatase family membrane protein YuiD